MIEYIESASSVSPEQLNGFFVGWPSPPSPKTHLRLLAGSDEVCLAVDMEQNRVVGFITAITDRVISAYIPLLEVLPEYQGRGIGRELVNRLLTRFADLYMIDVICDKNVQPFYEYAGFQAVGGMARRNYNRQDCR